MEFRKRVLIGFAISGGLVCCGGGGIALYFGLKWFDFPIASRETEAAAAAYRKAGLPWEAKDLAPNPPVAEAENAAKLLNAAFTKFPNRKFPAVKEQIGKDLDAGNLAAAESAMSNYQPALSIAKSASKRPRLDFHRDWDRGPTLLFPEFDRIKSLVSALSIDAEIAAKKGDAKRASEDLASANRLAILVGQEPTVIAMLVRIAGQRIALSSAERCAASLASNPAALASIGESIEGGGEPPTLGRALSGEAYMALATVRNIELMGRHIGDAEERPIRSSELKRTGLPRGMIARSYATRVLQSWTEVKTAFEENPDDLNKGMEIDAVTEKYSNDPGVSGLLVSNMFPVFAEALKSVRTLKADQEVKGALIEAMLIHAKTGKWPNAIEAIPGIWNDPFTNRPLKLKLTKDGIRIYSLGPNLRDDGGTRVREVNRTDGVNFDIVGAFPPIRRQERN